MTGHRSVAVACGLALSLGALGCGGSDDATQQSSNDRTNRRTAPPPATAPNPTKTNALGRRELPEVRRTLNRLISGLNNRDASICTRVYTPRYREELLERKGTAALTACRKAVSRQSAQTTLVRLERVDVRRRGGTVTGNVQVVQRYGTSLLLRTKFVLVRGSDGYRIDRGRSDQISSPQLPAT